MPKTLLPNCLIPSRQTCRPFSDWRRLGRGSGHKRSRVSNRRVEHDTAVLTDTWFHYDQVGSVLSESDASGNLVATHYQDAFGVRQADWETGLPGGVGEGWAHNTKELDGGTGLMYMYQRHYVPEYGQFMSRAPYEVMVEHEYSFAEQNPIASFDPLGEFVIWDTGQWDQPWRGWGFAFTGGSDTGDAFWDGVYDGLNPDGSECGSLSECWADCMQERDNMWKNLLTGANFLNGAANLAVGRKRVTQGGNTFSSWAHKLGSAIDKKMSGKSVAKKGFRGWGKWLGRGSVRATPQKLDT
jgi:RHS repeat-associated protein